MLLSALLWDLGTTPSHLSLVPLTLLGVSWLQCWGRDPGTLSDSAEAAASGHWPGAAGCPRCHSNLCVAGRERRVVRCRMASNPCLEHTGGRALIQLEQRVQKVQEVWDTMT